jgi:hypothetical protein
MIFLGTISSESIIEHFCKKYESTIMQTLKAIFYFVVLGFMSGTSFAQSMTAFQSMIYPRSITSSGLGEQGVASRSVFGAMQYNPANLVYADELDFSIFRNPWNLIGWVQLPLTSVQIAVNLGNCGSVGVEYTYWDFGEFMTTTPDFIDVDLFHSYERSIAGGYAMSLSDHFAVGAQIRYMWQPISSQRTIHQLLFSAGLSYHPEIFSERLNMGLSFMNFGSRIEYSSSGRAVERMQSAPPPSQINIGIEGLVVTDDFYDLSLAFSATKPLDKMTGAPDYSAQSSFKSLFNDWTDFPEDVTARVGLGFIWHPIYLGSGISFFQEMYLGYFSTGPKDLYDNFYTHGIKVGLDVCGVRATAGYAGRWHNNNSGSYLAWVFPWESFQFSLSTDISMFGEGKEDISSNTSPRRIILAAGYSYGLAVGRMKGVTSNGLTESFSMKSNWSVESDFYICDNSAIISLLHYSRMTENITIDPAPFSPQTPWKMILGIETASLESGFRYHPIEFFNEFFVQASIGVIWVNPVYKNTYQKYMYKAVDEVAVGFILPLTDLGVVVIPKLGLRTIFMEIDGNGSRLGGYSQFEFGLNAGYEI